MERLSSGIIRRTLEEAEKSTYKVHIGATIFKNSRIISSGHNSIRSFSAIHPRHKDYPNGLHAEISAIIKCRKDWSTLTGCSILVLKVSKTLGLLSMAKPCEYCYKSLKHVGIKNIYYSNSEGEIVKL
jgi:deoxycytidylate deaminase